MAIAAEMVVPILIGAWIDGRLGTHGALAILGGVLGVTVGIWSLLRMVEPLRQRRDKTSNGHDGTRKAPP
jgi:F0F1-type ATP synthase assembly protein I